MSTEAAPRHISSSTSTSTTATLDQLLTQLGQLQAEGLDARAAAAYCGVSKTAWYSMDNCGHVPAAMEMGTSTIRRWSRTELRAWMLAGCPSRSRWLSIRESTLKRLG